MTAVSNHRLRVDRRRPPGTAIPKLTFRFDKAGEKRVVDSLVERV